MAARAARRDFTTSIWRQITAQLECLLDEVVIGKQEMIGAIDAVCDVAQRIIGKLQEGAVAGGPPLLGAVAAGGSKSRPPTSAMKRFADKHRPGERRQTSTGLCEIGINLPRVPQSARAQEGWR